MNISIEQANDDKQQENQWAMFLHLSLLAGYVIPIAGLAAPIIIWQIKKADIPNLDTHGKIVVNWIISELIYGAVFALLAFVVVGVPLLFALAISGLVFPIIGGIKANKGEAWNYPMTIKLIK